MSGHTPGPWEVWRAQSDGSWLIRDSAGLGVANTNGAETATHEEANAHLIAAAPELLAELIENAPDRALCLCSAPGGEPKPCYVCRAHAAIAKARGGA